MKILVLGGNGFIGRNIVEGLQNKGLNPVIASRAPRDSTQIKVVMHAIQNAADWQAVIQDFDMVINSVGILRERGFGKSKETYAQVHTIAVQALAQACAAQNVRLIHISAFGLSANAKSGFIRSKYLGEQAIFNSGAQTSIVRVSLLDGTKGNGGAGYGAKWFRRVASWPVQLVMQSNGTIAPLQVTDLGEVVAALATTQRLQPIVELGGADEITIPQYLDQLRASLGKAPALQISVPQCLVRVASHLLDVLAWTPLSFGHFELMQTRNAPSVNSLPQLLGRRPSALGVNSKPFPMRNFQHI